jgi:hypothetical protein
MPGGTVSENFYFQGANTTFINRPKDTVIRDFQNSYGSGAGAGELGRLLELVLSSGSLGDRQREEAAAAVHELARVTAEGVPGESAQPVVRTRLERLRALLTGPGVDIAAAALPLLAAIAGLFTS